MPPVRTRRNRGAAHGGIGYNLRSIMPFPPPLAPAAFRDLERTLLRRRFRQLDPAMRLEIAAIAAIVAALVGWQLRLPLDAIAHGTAGRSGAGPLAAARALALVLAGLAALGAVAAGVRHARRLRPGAADAAPLSEWLALPIPPPHLARHLAWESRTVVAWALVPALAAIVAAAGLVPASWLVVLAVSFVALLVAAGHAGCALAAHFAARASAPAAGPGRLVLHPVERALLGPSAGVRGARSPQPRWRRSPAWLAVWRKDLLLTRRPTPVHARARAALVVMALSALAWHLPAEAALAAEAASVLALVAAAMTAAWLIELSGADPFATIHGLPVRTRALWHARAASAMLGAGLLVALQALVFPPVAPAALWTFLAWTAAATLTIGLLGAQLGLTLHPRAGDAHRVLGAILGVAVAASVMMPQLGWGVVLAAAAESARRLPRWSLAEEG